MLKSGRRWLKTSNGLIAVGIVLVLSGVQGVLASADRLQNGEMAFGPNGSDGGARQVSPIFIPPTLQLSPTPTPFDDIRPILGLETGMDVLAPAPPTPVYAPVLDPAGYAPDRIVIPSIRLDAPVVVSKAYLVTLQRQKILKWAPPDQFAGGWQETSAALGVAGNTVINGHNNEYGDVFEQLENVQVGDAIAVDSKSAEFHYQVTNRMILPELYQELAVRLANAQWIEPSQDERLTLVTCWPLNGNSHRLILVARPVGNSIQGK
jgi:LPXTG-site transpeptidase (sortase) family protein